jgi:hypothetical protein
MNKTAILVRYPAVLAFSVALSLAAGPVGTAERATVDRAAPSEPAIDRLHNAGQAARRHDPIPDGLQPELAGLHHDYADLGSCASAASSAARLAAPHAMRLALLRP